MRNYGLIVCLLLAMGNLTWQGYDWQRNSEVRAEPQKAVFIGDEIEIYDEKDNQFKRVRVEKVNDFGKTTEIEVSDPQRHKTHRFEMQNK